MWREGGSLIVAPFSAVFFAFLGPTYYALKLSAIAWHGLILLVWTLVARLAFGRREALAFGLLLACAPPFAARMQLIALVGHPEGNFFAGLALLGLVLLFRESAPRRRQLGAGLLGLSVTLGATFTYSAVPAVGLCLLLALRNHSRLKELWRILVGSMALGSLPWIAYFIGRVDLAAARLDSGGTGVLSLFLGASRGEEIYSSIPLATRMSELLSDHLFWMWGWLAPNESYRGAPNYVLGTAVFVLALLGCFRCWERRFLRSGGVVSEGADTPTQSLVAGFSLLYVGAYLSIAVVSGLSYGPDTYDGYRYLAPLFPTLLLLAAAGLGWGLHGTPLLRAFAALGAVSVCLAFVVGGPSLNGLPGPSPLHQLRGYNTHAVTRIFESEMSGQERQALLESPGRDLADLSVTEGRRMAGEDAPIPELLSCPSPPISCRLYLEGFAKDWVGSELPAPNAADQLGSLVTALRELPEAQAAAGFRGMGRGVSLNPPGSWWVDEAIPLVESLFESEREKLWFHEGIGMDEPLFRDFHYSRLYGGGQVPEHLAYCRGVGMGVARLLVEPSRATSPLPIPVEILEPVTAPPWDSQGVEAFDSGYEAERKRLVRP